MASRTDPGAAANAPAESVATTLSSAAFVRVVPRADGDALAAAGLLARALRRVDVPFQVRVAALGADAPATDGDGVLVAVGSEPSDADVAIAVEEGSLSLRAHEIATAIAPDDGGPASDSVLALAGVVAAGERPDSVAGSIVESAAERGAIVRRPGVAIPVDGVAERNPAARRASLGDVVDGLAHSTLFHAPFSGDADAVEAALSSLSLPADADERDGEPAESGGGSAERDEEARRSIASHLALSVAGDDEATPRAAEAVERALRPYATPDAPMATVGGFADVLNAVAAERPGTGVALALGHGGRDAALDAWREHAAAVHRTIRSGHTGRYDGVFAVRGEVGGDGAGDVDGGVPGADSPGRLATVARLVRDFRSPEPVVLALGDGVAALSTVESGAADAASALATEFVAENAAWTGDPTRAVARFDADAADADVIAAVREAVR